MTCRKTLTLSSKTSSWKLPWRRHRKANRGEPQARKEWETFSEEAAMNMWWGIKTSWVTTCVAVSRYKVILSAGFKLPNSVLSSLLAKRSVAALTDFSNYTWQWHGHYSWRLWPAFKSSDTIQALGVWSKDLINYFSMTSSAGSCREGLLAPDMLLSRVPGD